MTNQTDAKKPGKAWKDDLLNRQADAQTVIDFTRARVKERAASGKTASYVLNIDAGWGAGKTFFLERMQQQLENEDCIVAYVNAWRDDHADDPLLPVMAAIKAVFSSRLDEAGKNFLATTITSAGKAAMVAGKHVCLQIGKKWLGDQGLEEISACAKILDKPAEKGLETFLDAQGEALLESFADKQSAIEEFRSSLGQLVEHSKQLPIYILVDEVDRCRPTYAIALLERVKHLFEVDGVVFVIATETRQLQHSIKAVYGQEFDAQAYLRRFFDRTYTFAEPERSKFVAQLFANAQLPDDCFELPGNETAQRLFLAVMDMYGLELRDIEQCFDNLRSIVTLWSEQWPKMYRPNIQYVYLVGLIGLYHTARDTFETLIDRSSIVDMDAFEANLKNKTYNVHFAGIRGLEREDNLSLHHLFLKIHEYARRIRSERFPPNNTGRNSYDWIECAIRQEKNVTISNPELKNTSLSDDYAKLIRTAGRLHQ